MDSHIFGEFQVAPSELESVLRTHPAVADCAVVGIPDEAVGEAARAYVVKRDGAEVTEEEIIGFVAGREESAVKV